MIKREIALDIISDMVSYYNLNNPMHEEIYIKAKFENTNNDALLGLEVRHGYEEITDENYKYKTDWILSINKKTEPKLLTANPYQVHSVLEKIDKFNVYTQLDVVYDVSNNKYQFVILPMEKITPKSMHLITYAVYNVLPGLTNGEFISQKRISKNENFDAEYIFQEFAEDFSL